MGNIELYERCKQNLLYFLNVISKEEFITQRINLEKFFSFMVKLKSENEKIIIIEHERGEGLTTFFDFWMALRCYFLSEEGENDMIVSKTNTDTIRKIGEYLTMFNEKIFRNGAFVEDKRDYKYNSKRVCFFNELSYNLTRITRPHGIAIFDNLVTIKNKEKFSAFVQSFGGFVYISNEIEHASEILVNENIEHTIIKL